MSRRKLEGGRRSDLAGIVALALIAVAILVAVAAIQIHAGRDSTALGHVSTIADRLRSNDWNQVGIVVGGIVLAVLGLGLLVAGLLPARRQLITLADLDERTICGISRKGLARDLAATAAGVDGVVGAKVRLHRRRISVRATTGMTDRRALADDLRTAIQRRVDGLEPARGFLVRTRVKGASPDVHRRTIRANRIGLVLLGLLLLVAGAYLLARNHDLIPGQPARDPLYSRAQSDWLHRHDWIWFAVAAAAAGVGLVALRWLLVQPRIDRIRRVYITPAPDQQGRTVVGADVVTDAVEDDVTGHAGVSRARALLIGSTDAPELVLRVTTNARADLGEIREHLATHALPALRAALDADALPAQVHLVIAGRSGPRRSAR